MSELMLDTDISSYIIRRRPASLVEKFHRHADSLCVSAMTAAELRFGAEKAGRAQLADLVEAYLERVVILDWTASVWPLTHESARRWNARENQSVTWICSSPRTRCRCARR